MGCSTSSPSPTATAPEATKLPHPVPAPQRSFTLTQPAIDGVVTEADLARLPEPLAAYVRQSGAVGQPRVSSLRADIHGRIRSGPDAAWMPFTGEQVNTYGEHPRRAFIIDATRSGLPLTVLHLYDHTTATMRGRRRPSPPSSTPPARRWTAARP